MTEAPLLPHTHRACSDSEAQPPARRLPVALLKRIAEHIYAIVEMPAQQFSRRDLDELRECYDVLDLREDALAALQEHVELLSNSSTSTPLIRRRLLPANPATDVWERETLFRGAAVRGPCCYLKLRFYDQQPSSGVPDYSDACYYATVGVMLVPAMPPIVQCLVPVDERSRSVLRVVDR